MYKSEFNNMATLPLIVFDVNETLLDLQTLEPTFEPIFGEKGAMRLWFANFILYSVALTVAGCYVPFSDTGSAVMKMLADTQGVKIDEADKQEVFDDADGAKHLKPSRQAYAYVERELGVEPSQLCLVACHTWDTLGAVATGWEAAMIRRVGNDVLGVGPQAHIVGDDLNDVADQLIARHRARS
jgi:2-haloacid dehalogenase